jgi:hypothetical protein
MVRLLSVAAVSLPMWAIDSRTLPLDGCEMLSLNLGRIAPRGGAVLAGDKARFGGSGHSVGQSSGRLRQPDR